MNCNGFTKRLDAYWRGELSPGEVRAVESHRGACPRCAVFEQRLREGIAGLRSAVRDAQPLGGVFTRRILQAFQSTAPLDRPNATLPALRVVGRRGVRGRGPRRLLVPAAALTAIPLLLAVGLLALSLLRGAVPPPPPSRIASGVALLHPPAGGEDWRVAFPGAPVPRGSHAVPFPGVPVEIGLGSGASLALRGPCEVVISPDGLRLLRGEARIDSLRARRSIRMTAPGADLRITGARVSVRAPLRFGPPSVPPPHFRSGNGGAQAHGSTRVEVEEGRVELHSASRPERRLAGGDVAEILRDGTVRIAPAGLHPRRPPSGGEGPMLPFDYSAVRAATPARDALRGALASGNPRLEAAALRVSGMLGLEGAGQEAFARLRDPRAPLEARIAAVDVLEDLGSTAFVPLLVRLAEDPATPPPLRRRSLEGLAAASGWSPLARGEVEDLLRGIGPERVAHRSEDLSRDPAGLAVELLGSLSKRGGAADRLLLSSVLEERDPSPTRAPSLLDEAIRFENGALEAVLCLGFALEGRACAPDLRRLVSEAPTARARGTAALLLALLGERDALPAIRAELRSQIALRGAGGIEDLFLALERLGAERLDREARAVLARGDFHTRSARRVALQAIPAGAARPGIDGLLWGLLDDEDPQIQAGALALLARERRPLDRRFLEELQGRGHLQAFLASRDDQLAFQGVLTVDLLASPQGAGLRGECAGYLPSIAVITRDPGRSPPLRVEALNVVGILLDPGERTAILEGLARDEAPEVARAAIRLLARGAAEIPAATVRSLEGIAATPPPESAAEALEALLRLVDGGSLPGDLEEGARAFLAARIGQVLDEGPDPLRIRLVSLAAIAGRIGIDVAARLPALARDPDPALRLAALEALERGATPAGSEAILAGYVDLLGEVPSEALQREALEGMRRVGAKGGGLPPHELATLLEGVLHPSDRPEGRRLLLTALRTLWGAGEEPGERVRASCAASGSWWLRACALAWDPKGEGGRSQGLARLLRTPPSAFLKRTDPGRRAAWLESLDTRGRLAPADTDRLLEVLLGASVPWSEVLHDEFSLGPARRSVLGDAFTAYLRDRRAVLDRVRAGLESPAAQVRATALRTLAHLGGVDAVDAMLVLLRDGDPAVRGASLRLLLAVPGTRGDLGFDPSASPESPDNRRALVRWDRWRRRELDPDRFVLDRLTRKVTESLAR